ncbi:tRNA (5-methylaminomethyl-2-thiouridine)(34)-methyltransferase MnmD [Jejudonia soesokkakensis]|uniref:tRNA (5-methylaminomethyl-2-thiouridine)(34)-methyltransferase MnmD n=1 Tax=Jejudonia soesokkakensis TaxID=1323432 RepID=A0ABW2MXD5_9FLAO
MKREFLTTGDGSVTIHLPDWNEQYHSKHGAINEALHVFIEAGIRYFMAENSNTLLQPMSILEVGFGTGLNAFLSCIFSEKNSIAINYTGVEAYPIIASEIKNLNYATQLDASKALFEKLHTIEWEVPSEITTNFTLTKQQKFFNDISDENRFQLIFFDAFGARVQPELWTKAIFQKMYFALQPRGVLVTYAAKGSVRRAMQAVGFKVERLPGPPGKREMLRAVKN